MKNRYNYAVFRGKYNIPLHIVIVESIYLSSFSVFNNARDAIEYIKRIEKRDGKMYFDSDMDFSGNCLNAYLSAEHLFSDIESKKLYCRG